MKERDPRTPMEVVRAVYDSHEHRDTLALVDLLHPEVVWYQAEGHPYAGDRPWRGPAEVVEHVVNPINEDWNGFLTHVEEYIDAGDQVIVLGRYTGTHLVTGSSIDAQVCVIYTIASGLIVRWQQYTDTYQLRNATELGPDNGPPGF